MKQNDTYEPEFVGGKENTYIFTTSEELTYEVKFKPSGYLFGNEYPFAKSFYELVIVPDRKDLKRKHPSDPRIGPTIAKIAIDFFAQREVVFLYICDNSDGRGAVHDRMFDKWYYSFVDNVNKKYFKFDLPIGEFSERYFTTIIGRTDNPYKAQIILAYMELVEGHDK